MSEGVSNARPKWERRHFIGGSDARIIMGKNEAALLRLLREKRGEVAPEARKRPVLMLFEDVHWIDATSLEALNRAVDVIASLRALLIVTFRLYRWHSAVCG